MMMIRLFFFEAQVIRRLLLSNHLSSYYSIIAHYIYAICGAQLSCVNEKCPLEKLSY